MKKIFCTVIALILLAVPMFAEINSDDLTVDAIYENLEDELDYLNQFVGCSGPIHNPDDHIIINGYDIYSPNAKFTSYSKTKAELLEFCSPYLTMVALGSRTHINVNDKIYSYDEFLAPFTEGGMPYYNTVEIISSSKNSALFNLNYTADGEILFSGVGEYVKIDGEWKLNAVDGMIGQTSQSQIYEDAKIVFSRYVANVIRSYIVSENQSCGYGKYLGQPSNSGSVELVVGDVDDVVITEFNEADCTGSAYILIHEYDRNQNQIATRTITAIIGENLSENVTSDAPSNANPNTADFSGLYIIFAVFAMSTAGIVFNRKKVH